MPSSCTIGSLSFVLTTFMICNHKTNNIYLLQSSQAVLLRKVLQCQESWMPVTWTGKRNEAAERLVTAEGRGACGCATHEALKACACRTWLVSTYGPKSSTLSWPCRQGLADGQQCLH